MRVVLIQPPVEDFYDTPVRLQPVGLCSLKAAVEARLPGVRVRVLDFHQGWGRRTLALPPEFRYLAPYYAWADRSPFSLFHSYWRFGADTGQVADRVRELNPDLVGVSSLFSPYAREVLECARAVRAAVRAPIVLGGAHVSARPEMMLEPEYVDFVVRGEGERPLVELVRALRDGGDFERVPNLGYKRDGLARWTRMEPNDPLETLPAPDFSDLDPRAYCYDGKPMSQVLTSRGCPYRCTFCTVHTGAPDGFRVRPLDAVLDEMRAHHARGTRVFDFEDDHLAFDPARLRALCGGIEKSFGVRGVECLAMNGILHSSLDGELLGCMHRAGFTHLNLSLVSTDARVLRQVRRPPTDRGHVERLAACAHALGMHSVIYQILGLPEEPVESMVLTLQWLAGLPAVVGASVYYRPPAPEMTGDELFRARLSALGPDPDRRGALYTLWVAARVINFLKGLDLGGEAALDDLLATPPAGAAGRAVLGLDLLGRLRGEGLLYAATRDGRKPLTGFRADLFRTVLRGIGAVATQAGGRIVVNPNSWAE